VRRLTGDELRSVVEFVTGTFGKLINQYSPDLMTELYHMAATPGERLLPTVGLRLRDESGARHFVLDPGWLEFVPAPADLDLRNQIAGGVEIWASDLLLLAEGREEAYLIYETAVRRWSNAAHRIGNHVHVRMFAPFAPRFQPDQFGRSYRARLAEVSRMAQGSDVAS
jgi:hypothetical protein